MDYKSYYHDNLLGLSFNLYDITGTLYKLKILNDLPYITWVHYDKINNSTVSLSLSYNYNDVYFYFKDKEWVLNKTVIRKKKLKNIISGFK